MTPSLARYVPLFALLAAAPLVAAPQLTSPAQAVQGRSPVPPQSYHVTVGDVLELTFPAATEFAQTVTVQPDGYIALREGGHLYAQGLTVAQLRDGIAERYGSILANPSADIVLKDFVKPYFIAAGHVAKPGRYDLRGATTLTQALAIVGGPSAGAKLSQVVLFRAYSDDLIEVKQIDVRRMYSRRDLAEDPLLRAGDTLYVPKSFLSSLVPFIPRPSLGLYMNGLG